MPEWQGFDRASHMARLTEREFKLRYRLSADGFYRLLTVIDKDLSVNEEKARASKWGRIVEPQTKLAIGRARRGIGPSRPA